MMQGWTIFAKQIIEELIKYDHEHGTEYAYFMSRTDNNFPDKKAIEVLSAVMSKVDRANQWEPVRPGKVVD